MPVKDTLMTRSAKGKGIERGFWAAHSVPVVDGKVVLTHRQLVELCPGSAFRVDCVCDECGRDFSAHAHNVTRHGDGRVLCKLCRMAASTLKVYGVRNIAQTPGFADRVKTTITNRGGYGYAVERYRAACLRKYGVDHPRKTSAFKQRMAMQLFTNGTAPASKMQRQLCDALGGMLNYPVGAYFVDIALDNHVVVEYDGSGHDLPVRMHRVTAEQFAVNEAQRERYLVHNGWRLIRVISADDKIDVDNVVHVVRLLIDVNSPVAVYTPAIRSVMLRKAGAVTGAVVDLLELGVD